MLKNKKNNFGGGKRIVMVGEEDIIDFGEEFGIVKFADSDGPAATGEGPRFTPVEEPPLPTKSAAPLKSSPVPDTSIPIRPGGRPDDLSAVLGGVSYDDWRKANLSTSVIALAEEESGVRRTEELHRARAEAKARAAGPKPAHDDVTYRRGSGARGADGVDAFSDFTDKDLADDFAPGTSPKPRPGLFDAHVPDGAPPTRGMYDLDFGEEFGVAKYDPLAHADVDGPPAVKVGTPVDDIPRRVTPGRLSPDNPATVAAREARAAEARVASDATLGSADAADDVVRSGGRRISTALGGLKPKSAGGVLGLGLALAAGGAGVIYMANNRGKNPDYQGYE